MVTHVPTRGGEDRALAIVESITDAFLVLDRELRITYANRAAAKLAGVDRIAMVGRRPAEVLPHTADPEMVEAFRAVLERREPIVVEDYVESWDRWFESSVFPFEDGLTLYTRDITVKKRGLELAARLARHTALRADVAAALADERNIRAMLQRCCEALVDQLAVAFARVWTVDEAGTTLLLQASAGMYTHIDGAHGAVPVGKFKIGRIAASRHPHLTNDVQHDDQIGDPQWARRERMVAFAGYPLLVDGKLVGVLAMFSRAHLPEDTMSALAGIADTVAQGVVRRRTEIELEQRVDELARSNAELERFAYVASHDLQEPLRMVASYNQLLARRYKGQLGEDADEFIGYTVEGVTRMQRLINDLLAYSRVGSRAGDRKPVELTRAFDAAIANLGGAIGDANALISHDDLPRVVGDETQLAQLLQNLIGNAIKFHGDAPPKVHVGARRDGAMWAICVRDNGIGIAPEYFERVFVIFQRLHPREKYPGTGIGLAICKKIVERHGGKIWVESKPGEGSNVWFTLPAAQGRK
ncbi:MAG TPA: ATP-binding protein [Kofleriaceae bacterium]|nr:ATP-binding protein [Kofleriaceae bacterium]